MGTNITGIGNANAIGFKSRVTGGAYFPPELKDALVGVWSAYGKSNDSTDRNIIKNKIKDRGGDFVISNAAFKLNSGFGGFVEDFTSWDRIDSSTAEISNDGSKIKCINTTLNVQYLFNSINRDIPSFKVKISNFTKGDITYYYRKEDGIEAFLKINPLSVVNSDKVIELPKSYNTVENGTGGRGGFYSSNINIGVTITQIPSFEGAFVTDGIDDLITSTKTVQEMLGGSNELTIVSMVHQVKDSANNVSFTNYIRGSANGYFRNIVNNYDKTGIYGYTSSDLKGLSVVNNILGDKNDYTSNGDNRDSIINGNFSVQGYSYNDGNNTGDFSSVAWYWTIIANKVLTTDQINQVIAYFNLDRTLKPDILCNIGKQGITNDNHSEFNDKLIDYSGNGRDIQMNNLAWKGGSGIAAKPYETIKDYTIVYDKARQELTIYNEFSYKVKSNTPNHYWVVQSIIKDNTSYQVTIITDKDCYWINATSFINSEGNKETITKKYPVLANTPTQVIICGLDQFEYPEGIKPTTAVSYVNLEYAGEITVTFIPSYKGGLLLDGVNDFGKVTGMPIYKDYTVVADYERFYLEPITGGRASILSKSSKVGDGSFIFNLENQNGGKACYTFGEANGNISDDITRIIRYQSKYYNTKTLSIGTAEDNDFMVLGKVREVDSRHFCGAIYSLMSFPYSMSEFLIERQLKKHKLGTLYPDMVEWRPIIKSNVEYASISYLLRIPGQGTVIPVIGQYYPILSTDTSLVVYVATNGVDEVANLTINGQEPTSSSIHVDGRFKFEFPFNNSPQKINITIDEYIRYEDIVQPYPVIFKVKDRTTNQIYSWGDRIKIGSSIQLIHGENPNLLPELYSIISYTYEGNSYSYNQLTNLVITVTKTISVSCQKTWKLGNNEPKCILSPKRLKLANSSYKYLGYIPDISGNGNHGVFNNFAFSKMSGADGYPYDYKSTSDFVVHARNAVLVNSETVKFINVLTQTSFYYKGTSYKGKIKVTGITKAIASGKVRYLDIYSNSPTNNDRVIIDKDGIYDVNIETEDAINIFFYLTPIVSGTTALDEPVYLEQVGNYEGSICFDGVDDYMDIPSLSIGGKQVLMKTNWLKSPTLLYDQRASGSFAILTTKEDDATNPRIAYQARNQDGKTYIDGIENNYIETYSLKGITHNITVTNPSAGSGVVPVIGANTGKSSGFAKMALYDFMLFDEVSTNEEIKQLNDIVGIEGNYVQRPPYYWDTHGKSNLDGDRGTIPQLGTAEDYSFTSFDNEIDWYLSSSNYIDVVSRNGYKITLKNLSTGIDGWRFQNSTVKRFILNDIPFKIKSNKTIRVYWDMHYNAISSTELRQKVVSVTTINPNEDTLINLRHLTEEELTELNVNKSTMYYLLWFDVSTLAVNEEVTIEMLPVEGGRNLWLNNYGFAYDKMSGYEGYSFKSFNDSQSWNIRGDSTGVEIISRNGYSMTVKKLVQNLDWQISNNEYRYPTILDKEVPFKCKSNKNVGLIWQLKYKTEGATSDTTVTLINQQLTPNVPLEISLPYKTQDELTELGAVSTSVYYLLYFSNTLLEIGEEYTVEMLPLYPNGLVYDGVDDYSENTSIPAFTDYTYIIKYEDFNNPNTGSCIQRKGSIKAGGGAFVQDHIYRGTKYQYNFGISSNIHKDDSIAFCTRTNYNGTAIPSGNNTDDTGFTIGKFDGYRKMVFYKEMLYPRTVNMLTINMIKNMMAEDGIIDIQGKLFTDKFTGDFNLDFNKDFLIGN